jgi:hypothetical protein
MKISAAAASMLIAVSLAGGPAAMAAETVGGVGGDGNTSGDGSTGSAATFGGGGSSFAGPAGTDTPPGIVTALATLARGRNAGAGTVSVDSPGLRSRHPGAIGSGAGAGPLKAAPSPVRQGN